MKTKKLNNRPRSKAGNNGDAVAELREENARDGEFFTLIVQQFSEIEDIRQRADLAQSIGARLITGTIPEPKGLWQVAVVVSERLKEAFVEGKTDHPKVHNLIEEDKELERAIEAVRKSALPPRVSHRLADRLRDASEAAAWKHIEISISIAFIMGLMADKLGPKLPDTYSTYRISPEV